MRLKLGVFGVQTKGTKSISTLCPTYDLLLQPREEQSVLLHTGICCNDVPGANTAHLLVQTVGQKFREELGLEFGVGVKEVQQFPFRLQEIITLIYQYIWKFSDASGCQELSCGLRTIIKPI